MPRLRKRSGRPPLSLLKAVQVRFAVIGCLRARTVRLRELLRCCKFTHSFRWACRVRKCRAEANFDWHCMR